MFDYRNTEITHLIRLRIIYQSYIETLGQDSEKSLQEMTVMHMNSKWTKATYNPTLKDKTAR